MKKRTVRALGVICTMTLAMAMLVGCGNTKKVEDAPIVTEEAANVDTNEEPEVVEDSTADANDAVTEDPAADAEVVEEAPAFEARQADETGNYVTNSDFSDATEDLTDDVNWKFILMEGGEGTAEIKDNMIEIVPASIGNQEYSVQLVHWDIPLYEGHKYKVTFDAKAAEERKMKVAVTAPFQSWVRYLNDTTVDLTTEWQTFTYDIEMSSTDERGRLEFNTGKQDSTATINITNVRVEEVTE